MHDIANNAQYQHRLAALIGQLITQEGDIATEVPHLNLFRREQPTDPEVCLVETSILVVVQGAKQMWLDGRAFTYQPSDFLITSLDLPARSSVIQATPTEPCLGFYYKLDQEVLASVLTESELYPAQRSFHDQGMGLGKLTTELIEPFWRLFDLINDPAAIPVLAPLIQREIHYRLLRSDQGERLRQLVTCGSQSQRIATAINWLKLHFQETLNIEHLAEQANISTSSLYQHFRYLTGMSPLQYQKCLRLTEARRLMLVENLDAAQTAYQVGYESPSQFSREYRRIFGLPPKKDIEQLRQTTDQ